MMETNILNHNDSLLKESYDISNTHLFFIIGRSRSGTTLLQTMLDANPNLSVAPECLFIMNLYNKYKYCKWNRNKVLDFYNDLWLEKRLKTWDLNKEKLRRDLLALESRSNFRDYCKVVFKNYAELHGSEEAIIFGDLNHHYCLFVKELASVFPDAKFVHIVRDFRDNVLSHTKLTFESNNSSILAYRWKKYNKEVLKISHFLENRILRIRYEDLVIEPEKELMRVCTFLGVDFHSSMLEHYKNKRSSFSDPWQPNIKKPINRNRLYAWKKEMSKTDVLKCEYICKDIAQLFGYEVTTAGTSVKLYISTLPGVLYGWLRTMSEKILFLFSFPVRLRARVITFSRKINKSF
ncbi:hypothetical protein C6A37_01640 [Desulfobacteraceae bacterium SEEP-SAG9]|nr:hypothetical protein C6A37_01640 [Desulfobacteraceae bacterium SEEP-SAG9]